MLLILMRMRIFIANISARRPSRMSQTNITASMFRLPFVYHFFNTFFRLFNGHFSHLKFFLIASSSDDAGTVVASVLEEFDSFGNYYFGSVLGRDDAEDTTAFVFFREEGVVEEQAGCSKEGREQGSSKKEFSPHISNIISIGI